MSEFRAAFDKEEILEAARTHEDSPRTSDINKEIEDDKGHDDKI